MGYKKTLVVEDDIARKIVLEEIASNLDVLGDHYATDNIDDAKSYIKNNEGEVELVIMGWELPASVADPMADSENGAELLRFVQNCGIKVVICSTRASDLTSDPDFSGIPVIMPNPFDSLEERIRRYLT